MNTFDKVKEVIVDTLNCDEALVVMGASLTDDLGADSLDAVELIMALEDSFEISVPEDRAKEISTVDEIVALVDSLS
ncbi:MAG: acyl carrier protein [Oscillospiraceae bacterium]|jgi:acyl carrier protein|nr:acyl carrier protein [Oscillospiraceae bacterium]